MTAFIDQAVTVLREHGLDVDAASLDTSGKLTRCAVIGKNGNNKDGAYWVRLDARPTTWWENFPAGDSGAWSGDGEPARLTDAERAEIDQLRRNREAEQLKVHEQTAKAAQAQYNNASKDQVQDHGYAKRKAVDFGPHVRRFTSGDKTDCLLVPAYDKNAKLWTLQRIADGKAFGGGERDKDFLKDGRIGGCFCPVGTTFRNAAKVLIGEGLATVAAAVQATGLPGVVAFDAGNLVAVAKVVRELAAPGADIIILADDDQKPGTRKNPGVEAANKAAQVIGGRVALPGMGKKADFWDVLNELGADAVRERIKADQANADEYQETDDLRPTEYVIDGFLGCGPTYIAGAHGVGKSSLLVPLASIITGELEGIFGVNAYLKRRVIYFAEDPEQIDRVRYGLRKYCELKRNGNFFIRRTKRLNADAIKVLVTKLVKEHTIAGPNGYQVKPLLIFDTLSASFELENENDNAEAAKYLSALKESGGTAPIWVIGHIPKAMLRADVENMTGRGAGAWEGDAQGTAFIFAEADGPQNIRYLRTRKRRFEASYVESRFETSMRPESRVAAWGEEQTIIVRFGVPERSDEESRKQDVQGVVDEKRVQTVTLAKERIRDFLRKQSAPVSRNDIEKNVTELNSPRTSAREAIQELERDGEVEVVEKYLARDGKARKNGLQIVWNFASEV